MSTLTRHCLVGWPRQGFRGRGGRRCRGGADGARPMTRVFLSFASEDAAIAERFAEGLQGLGVKVCRFDAPSRRAGGVVGEIEDEVARADLFVLLLSPHYRDSSWCQQERDLAIQRDNEMTGQFVHVVKVAETPPESVGTLRNYHWLDATGEATAQLLHEI